MLEKFKYAIVVLLLIILGRSMTYAQFKPAYPPEPDMPQTLYKVKVTANPDGIAWVSGAGKYAEGTKITLNTSLYSSSYVFSHWTKDGEKYSEDSNCNYTVGKADVEFVAVYKFKPSFPVEPETDRSYELFLSASPESSCSFNRTSGERVEAGQYVSLYAYPNQGFEFSGWYDGDTKVSSDLGFDFIMPEKRTTLVAKFVYRPVFPDDPSNGGEQDDVDPGTSGAVTEIILNKTLLYLPIGDSYTLKATVSPDNATDKTVTWTTSNASVATVVDGVVAGVSAGKAVITAKAGSKTVTCDVNVVIPVTSVTLNKSSLDLPIGEDFTLTASVLPDNATDKTVVWKSSNTSVATVDNGVVTSRGLGEAEITAQSGDIVATCNVRVIIPVNSIIINKTTADMIVGESITLKAETAPSNATDNVIAWSTSDSTIATVDNDGVVKALKAGKVTITAFAGGKSATCTINIIVPVSGITLDKTTTELLEGESLTLKATVSPDNATDKTVAWSTSDASIATVDNNGVVKGIKVGKVTITAKAGEKTAICEVTVKPVLVSGISLDKSNVELLEGETTTLKATVEPSNATDKTVTWSTSDASIATVDNNGVVKAIKIGKVTITAKAGDKTATCEVTVKPVPVSGIVLDKTNIELLEGETITLKATVSPDNATDKTITWSSSDASIATVDNNGVVKAIKVGKVTITAKAGDKTATCEVTVKPVPVSGIVLDKASVELLEGESITLKATVSPDNATDKTITWSSSDASIATVDNNGVVKAIKVGKVTITAKAGDKTATCEVTVKPVPVSGIVLDKASVELLEGETTTLKATVSPDDATIKTITWSSSDASIATVDNNGVVKAIKVGKVTITAKAGDKIATCEVTVKPVPVSGIVLDKASIELLEGESITLKATVSPDNATDKTVTWSTSDASIATVDNNGVVKAIKVGKVTITAKAGDMTATCVITIIVPTDGIVLDKITADMIVGESLTLNATIYPENATDKTITWSTSDATIATVDNGVVKALKAGTVTITAKVGDKTATCVITITVPVSGITLDKTNVELLEGETTTLKATVSPDNATDKTITWSTSDATIATVDNNGVVKAIKVGKVTITAKAGDKTATCEVTVKPVPVSGIVLDKTNVELLEGETTTLKATVSPDNATDKTITWSSSDASIATVDNNGVVKAIKVGKVTIAAKAGDKTATCEVTVKPIPVIEITLDKTTAELVEGESLTIVATVSPDNATDKTVTWSTSDASIATVDNNGVVKAVKAGKVTITAEAGGLTATCEITVVGKETDGIDEVMTSGNLDIYDIRGRLVKKSATSLDALPKGIYIVNGKKISVK